MIHLTVSTAIYAVDSRSIKNTFPCKDGYLLYYIVIAKLYIITTALLSLSET